MMLKEKFVVLFLEIDGIKHIIYLSFSEGIIVLPKTHIVKAVRLYLYAKRISLIRIKAIRKSDEKVKKRRFLLWSFHITIAETPFFMSISKQVRTLK